MGLRRHAWGFPGLAGTSQTGARHRRKRSSVALQPRHLESRTDPSRRGVTLIAALILIMATVVTYGRVCRHEWLDWDDRFNVVDNAHVNPPSWTGVAALWSEPYGRLYVPVAYSFFTLETALATGASADNGEFALDPRVFHAGNLVLHMLCALVVFLLLKRLVSHTGAALIGALLFAVHPLQTEAVAWITETRGLLATLFGLVAVWQYLAFAERVLPQSGGESGDVTPRRRIGWVSYVVASIALVLALLSKPSAAAVPLVAGLLDVGLRRRSLSATVIALLPWLAVVGVIGYWTQTVQPESLLHQPVSFVMRPLVAVYSLAFYIFKLIWPFQLGPDYGLTPQAMFSSPAIYFVWLVPLTLIALIVWSRERRVWLTAMLLAVAAALPTLGLVSFAFQETSTVADRYFYFAMIGPALAVAWWLARRWNTATVAVCVTILVVLASGGFLQAGHWINDEALFAHALTVNPHSNVAHASLGYRRYSDALARRRTGDEQEYREAFEQAVKHYQAAVTTNPYDFRTQNHLGWAMREQGRLDEAEEHYRAAIDAKPDFAAAHNNLGLLYAERRDWEQAARSFARALELEPEYVEAVNNLAQVHAERREYDDAVIGFRRAIELKEDYAAPHFNLADVLVERGHYDEAIGEYRRALAIAPGFADGQEKIDEAQRLRQARLGN